MAPVLGGGPIVARLFYRYAIRPVIVADFCVRAGVYGALAVWLTGHGVSRESGRFDAQSSYICDR